MSYYTGHQISLEGNLRKFRIRGPFEVSTASHRDSLKFKRVPRNQTIQTRDYYVGYKCGRDSTSTHYNVEGPIRGGDAAIDDALKRVARIQSASAHPHDLIVVEMESA